MWRKCGEVNVPEIPDRLPVLALSAYRGKRVDDMTRDELVEALNAVWSAYVAVNARGVTPDATRLPDRDLGAYDAVLSEWFYGDARSA